MIYDLLWSYSQTQFKDQKSRTFLFLYVLDRALKVLAGKILSPLGGAKQEVCFSFSLFAKIFWFDLTKFYRLTNFVQAWYPYRPEETNLNVLYKKCFLSVTSDCSHVGHDSHQFAPWQLLQQNHQCPPILNVCEQVVHGNGGITLEGTNQKTQLANCIRTLTDERKRHIDRCLTFCRNRFIHRVKVLVRTAVEQKQTLSEQHIGGFNSIKAAKGKFKKCGNNGCVQPLETCLATVFRLQFHTSLYSLYETSAVVHIFRVNHASDRVQVKERQLIGYLDATPAPGRHRTFHLSEVKTLKFY